MDDSPKEEAKSLVGRRRFLQSLFGLTAVSEGSAVQARSTTGAVSFFWANLRNGQIAFPTGMSVPSGQPGSLMKLVTAAALRESGLFTGDEKIDCKGSIEINKHVYHCLKAHGPVDLIKAIGLSCNVFFAQASQKLSPTSIIEYAHRFGFDQRVAGTAGGHLPLHPAGDPAQFALGLNKEINPDALQLLRMVALIALQGQVPPLHNAAESAAGEKPFCLELQPSTWHALQQGMRIAERQGTARHLDPADRLKIAAKTGTAPHGKAFQSWIAGYFPADDPKYAFCLRATAGTSQDSAVPAARTFLFQSPWP